MPRYSVKLYATPLAEVAFRTVEVEAPNAYRAPLGDMGTPQPATRQRSGARRISAGRFHSIRSAAARCAHDSGARPSACATAISAA